TWHRAGYFILPMPTMWCSRYFTVKTECRLNVEGQCGKRQQRLSSMTHRKSKVLMFRRSEGYLPRLSRTDRFCEGHLAAMSDCEPPHGDRTSVMMLLTC